MSFRDGSRHCPAQRPIELQWDGITKPPNIGVCNSPTLKTAWPTVRPLVGALQASAVKHQPSMDKV